jgi:serine/threonine protein kinase
MRMQRNTAEHLLATRGMEALNDVHRSPIFQEETVKRRQFPTFSLGGTCISTEWVRVTQSSWRHLTLPFKELECGRVLGVGTFGIVCEITHITLFDGEDPTTQKIEDTTECFSESFGIIGEEAYDDADAMTARKLIARRCMRNGQARYAAKRVRGDLDEFLEARGRIDLAIEVKFLHALSHPNIVKMRGVFQTDDPFHPDYFLVMDRLSGTLKERVVEWKRLTTSWRSFVSAKRWNGTFLKELMTERLRINYDIASAFCYIHSNKLVYRDIKPENIGFDVRGNVKVFDFGLTKVLDPELRNSQGMFHMTSLTGSFPYMAPEVASMDPYNEKCDVFSFGILIWEVLSLQIAYFAVAKSSFGCYRRVAKSLKRLPISRKWPVMTKHVMQSSWNHTPEQRPSMTTIRSMLRVDLEFFTEDDSIQGRTHHMLEQSNRSLQASADFKVSNE